MTEIERLKAEMEDARDAYDAADANVRASRYYAAYDAACDAYDAAYAEWDAACDRYHAALAAQTKEKTDD